MKSLHHEDVSGASCPGSFHIFDKSPFAWQQIPRRLERLAWSFRATPHSIELPLHYEKPAIDNRICERHKIIVIKTKHTPLIRDMLVPWTFNPLSRLISM